MAAQRIMASCLNPKGSLSAGTDLPGLRRVCATPLLMNGVELTGGHQRLPSLFGGLVRRPELVAPTTWQSRSRRSREQAFARLLRPYAPQPPPGRSATAASNRSNREGSIPILYLMRHVIVPLQESFFTRLCKMPITKIPGRCRKPLILHRATLLPAIGPPQS